MLPFDYLLVDVALSRGFVLIFVAQLLNLLEVLERLLGACVMQWVWLAGNFVADLTDGAINN